MNGTFVLEPPDLLVCRWTGRVGASAVEELFDGLHRTSAHLDGRLVLCDVARVTVVDERRRIALALRGRHLETRAVAFVGARFAVRTLATLLVRVAGLSTDLMPMAFFDSEADARAWLAAQRDPVLLARPAPPRG